MLCVVLIFFLFILINSVFGYIGYTIGLEWGKELVHLPVFRQTGKVENKTELLVFITPKIVSETLSLR